MTIRLLSHGAGKGPTTVHRGNATGGNAPGGVLDVADNDSNAQVYTANGWSRLGLVGTTAQRPVGVAAGTPYIDTTAGKTVWYDGVGWRDPITGASA